MLMSITLLLVDLIIEGTVDFGLIPAILLIYLEILLIVAFSIFFSSFVSPTLGAVFTLIIFILGHMSEFLMEYVQIYPDKGFHWILRIVYYMVTDLEKLNLKMVVVEHLKSPPHAFGLGCIYGIAYILFLLMVTSAIFTRKDLK